MAFGLTVAGCDSPRPAPLPANAATQNPPPVTIASVDARSPLAKADILPVPPDAEPTNAELAADSRNSNAFTLELLKRTKKPSDNTAISGTSVRHALGTIYLGARGKTANEMATALALDNDPKVAASLAEKELSAWQDARGGADLYIANRVWIDDDVALQPELVKTAERAFGAAPSLIDYAKPEDARKTINQWVASKTQQKIPELLPSGAVDPRTRLVVTNAIWFKSRWANQFPKAATTDQTFKAEGKKNLTTPMMHLTDAFRVVQERDVKVLEMRYADSQLAMLVVLPDETDPAALTKLETRISADAVERWTSALATARVNVTLPRFTFRAGGPMNGPLQELGMKIAFTDRADFSGIAEPRGGDRLFLNQVFHETYVAVDEIGTEAAAATGGVMRTTSLVTGPVVDFRADHPFLFFIQDAKRGRILFAGRVATPKS